MLFLKVTAGAGLPVTAPLPRKSSCYFFSSSSSSLARNERNSGALSCLYSRETSRRTVLHRLHKASRFLPLNFAGCHRRNGGEMATRARSVHTVRVRANFSALLLKLQYLQSVECSMSVEQRGRKSVFRVVFLW